MPTRVPPADRERMMALRRQGYTHAAIADITGWSRSTVEKLTTAPAPPDTRPARPQREPIVPVTGSAFIAPIPLSRLMGRR